MSDIIDKISVKDLIKPVYCVGKLEPKVIELLNLGLVETEIMLGIDRIKYFEKHKHEFSSEEHFDCYIELLPDMIKSPDYVGQHPTDNGVEFIKRIDDIVLIAVRVRPKAKLWVRSLYPISEEKLRKYINSGRVKKYV